MMENVHNNLLNLKFDDLEMKIKEYAKQQHVPIIFDEGLAFLESIIAIKQPKNILEIGTAIGYSAIRMHKVCLSNIYTIERDELMYNKALENVRLAGFEDSIHIIFEDALQAFSKVKDINFDLIFIDAAKAQYIKFFDLYTPLLNANGIVICDNMLFHGLVLDEATYDSQSRSVRGLIRKLNNFHDALLKNENFRTSIFNIGDGMSISIKK